MGNDMSNAFISWIREKFTHHPASVGETYFTHLRCAGYYGLMLILAGFACVIHCIFPFVFKTTASDTVFRLHDHMTDRKTGSSRSS